jgi:hypothetical protein
MSLIEGMAEAVNVVENQTKEIRDYINDPRKHYKLRQNKPLFSQLCSSLDVIGDTEQAITAFEAKEFGDSAAVHYLAVYGLFQAIYVQQDAVNNLCEALGIPENTNNYPKLRLIRDIRNEAVGHPTKKDKTKSKPISYHHISRASLRPTGFDIISFYNDGTYRHMHIEISEWLAEQKKYISAILSTLTGRLEAEDKAHKEKFRMEKLVNLLPHAMDYEFEKVFDGINTPANRQNGAICLKLIHDRYKKLIEKLKEREEYPANSVLVHHMDDILYPIKKLEAFFEDRAENTLSEKDAYIFASFLSDKHLFILGLLKEIDEEYEKGTQ